MAHQIDSIEEILDEHDIDIDEISETISVHVPEPIVVKGAGNATV